MSLINRKSMIQAGLNAARRKRADGGAAPSFPDMVAQNPRGWGNSPPPMPEPSPGQISAAREYLIQRDAAGNPDADAAQATGDLFPAISGINAAQRAGTDFARGRTAEGIGNTALAAAPYLGGPVAGAVTKYGPRIAAPAAGVAAMFSPSQAGESADSPEAELVRLQKELADLTAKRDAASQAFLDASKGVGAELTGKGATGKHGTGPTSTALAKQADGMNNVVARFNSEIDTKQSRINEIMHTFTPEYKREQDLATANERARMPWYQRSGIPGVETALTWGPSVATGLWARGKFNKIADEGTDLLAGVKGATNIGEEAAARMALDAWKRQAPKEAFKTAAKGIAVPGGFRNLGTFGDATFGPEVKDAKGNVQPGGAKQEAQRHIDRTFGSEGAKGVAEELGPPLGQGLEAILGGAYFARRPPLGPVARDTAYLKGIKNPDAGPMQKFLGRDDTRSMSPDQVAVELAKRRAGVPGSGSSTSTNPTPSWSTSMKAESTRPALPPPIASSPSDMTPPPALAPPTTSSQTAPPALELPPPSGASQSSASLPPAPAVRPVKDKGGRWRHPNTGNFTSAPAKTPKAKPTTNKPQKQPKASAAPQDDVPLDKNGIPIKPDRIPGDDDPGMRNTGGGVFAHAMSLARKYAKGGAVVGALVGNTGGRADKLSTSVPPGSHVIPADVVSHYGEGNTLRGLDVMKKMFGDDDDVAAMSAGGEVPVYLSDGEYVVSPKAVLRRGGHDAIDKFILDSRQEHIKTLASLPPPAR